jgi:hypothetical protein
VDDDAAAEAAYRWTVRALYLGAIALNVWVLYEQVKGTPELAAARARVVARFERAKRTAGARRHFARHANRVIYEATEIVEDAARA